MESRPRARTKLTYESYCLFPDDGKRHEIIDGDHFMNPSPSSYHQTLSRRIQFQLYERIELTDRGQVFDAPMDVHLSDHDIVQPDLVVVLENGRGVVQPATIEGVPDLVVEILSKSTITIDRTLKRDLYERVGIPQYWIVDPDRREVTDLVLEDERYTVRGIEQTRIAVARVDDVVVDLERVW